MGIDYSFWLVIGYKINSADLPKSMIKYTEEKFHMEDRYNQRTGKKLAPVKVIDEEGGEDVYLVNGKECEYTYEFADALADELGCSVEIDHEYSGQEFTIMFSIEFKTTGEDDVDWDRVSTGCSILFDDATSTKARAAVKKLGKDLKKLGIDPGPAKILIGHSVG